MLGVCVALGIVSFSPPPLSSWDLGPRLYFACSNHKRWCSSMVQSTLRASLSGTFLQTLPDLVTPLKGPSLSPRSCPPTRSAPSVKPVLNWANVCSPNILRTIRRTMIRFLIKLLIRRIWFGQSKLYFVFKWLVMRCKLRPELAADAQQTA